MLKRTVFVFWCFYTSVKGGTTNFDILRPTPVSNLEPVIQSTDALHPLKVNKDSNPPILTTGINNELDGIVKPTPVLILFQTTDVLAPMAQKEDALPILLSTKPIDDNLLSPSPVIKDPIVMETGADKPMILIKEDSKPVLSETTDASLPMASKVVPLIEQLATKPVDDNLIVSPSPVKDEPIILETNADNPAFNDRIEGPQISTTAAEVKPTPVISDTSLETKPVEKPIAVALVNEEIPEILKPSADILIEPSHVMDIQSEPTPTWPTPLLEDQEPTPDPQPNFTPQEPIQVSQSELTNPPVSPSVTDPCKCVYYEDETPISAIDALAQDIEDAFNPLLPLFTPEAPKKIARRPDPPPPIFLQHIINLQLNFFLHNLPIFQIHPPPLVY